jgi:CRISPR/Cas system-associated exonuclease Cas4 (RecB family)
VAKWVKCPEKFNYSYLKGYKEPETRYMRRGTTVHEAIEDYYETVTEYVKLSGSFPRLHELVTFFRDPIEAGWADYTEPYITNFLAYESRRLVYCRDRGLDPEVWLPVAVEAEEWLEDPLGYGDEAIPWMGYADAIYPVETFPEVPENDGVVIVDFKTGKTPKEDYRDDGIYLEGEYYAMLFASEYDVAAVAGYYPKNDDLIVSPLSETRREKIREVVHSMQSVNGENPGHLEINETPLCKWGSGKDEQCPYYDMCSSTWGEGLKNEQKFRDMAEYCTDSELATAFNMDYGAVQYTKYKLGL